MLPYSVGKIRITSPYGNRADPFTGATAFHGGIDFVGDNKNIVAVKAGAVIRSRIVEQANDTGATWQWGNYIAVQGSDGFVIYYCHLSKRIAQAGEYVQAGQLIGVEGSTGRSTGSHLHFEVRDRSGKQTNAADYLGINNTVGYVDVPDYADLVCRKCGFEAQTRAYIDGYKYAADLWRKLYEQMV